MSTLTLGEAKPYIAKVLNMTDTDTRVVSYINEAQRLLLDRGDWHGTISALQITATGGVITWPRTVAAVKVVAACKNPVPMKNQWYEFLGGYGGVRVEDCNCCNQLVMLNHGNSPLISDIIGVDKKVRAHWALPAADDGQSLLIKGLDATGNRIFTEYPGGSGTYIEGFYLVCDGVSLFTESPGIVSQIDSVLKTATSGFVTLKELAPATGVERTIAYYEPDELYPNYRRSLLDPFSSATCEDSCTGCTSTSVVLDALVKLAFRPAAIDSDYLLISSLQALKMAVMGIRKLEDNRFAEAEAYISGTINPLTKSRQGGAIGELQAQQRTLEEPLTSVGLRPHGTADLRYRKIGTMI